MAADCSPLSWLSLLYGALLFWQMVDEFRLLLRQRSDGFLSCQASDLSKISSKLNSEVDADVAARVGFLQTRRYFN